MILILIKYLFFQTIFSSAESQTNCSADSFFLSYYSLESNQLNITFNFKIEKKANIYNNCINRSILIAKSIDLIVLKEIVISFDRNLSTVFDNLFPFELFEILFRIKLTNSNDFVTIKNLSSHSCFGVPGKPSSLKSSVNDLWLNLEWKKPNTINAPHICFYLIEIISKNVSQSIEFNTNSTWFKFKKNYLNDVKQILISSVNHVRCYEKNFKLSEKCAQNGMTFLKSESISYLYDNNRKSIANNQKKLTEFILTLILIKQLIFYYHFY